MRTNPLVLRQDHFANPSRADVMPILITKPFCSSHRPQKAYTKIWAPSYRPHEKNIVQSRNSLYLLIVLRLDSDRVPSPHYCNV